ncbi:MAG: glycosyltransferase [Crocinitomicaceae bacterium]
MIWWRLDFLLAMGGYALLIGVFLLGRLRAKRKSDRLLQVIEFHSSDKISVIIPFRNEAENLPALLKSLSKLVTYPLEFVFVNDHSTDNSLELIENWPSKTSKKIISLNEEFGKKAAIESGVENASGEFILTWDADIEVSPLYFEKLVEYEWKDLMILPVEMSSENWISGFFSWDYQLQTQTALSLFGLGRPIAASGANLLFRKTVFEELKKVRTDQHILSGDDQFLLAACRKQGKSIHYLANSSLKVVTKAPNEVVSGLKQRSRWLKKSSEVKDSFSSVFGLFVLLVQLSFYALAIYNLLVGSMIIGLLLVLLKGELDAFLCTLHFQKRFSTLQVYLYEWCFPIYIFALLFYILFLKTTWKGR